jgi:hypothetical protein
MICKRNHHPEEHRQTLDRLMIIPDEDACFKLLEKYGTPHHIILHSEKVWQVARILAEGLFHRNHALEVDLLKASCLLHDIGKYPCIVDGTKFHDIRGEEILISEGYPAVARIVVQHVILRTEIPPVAEEHVLFYADKRVVHDEVVTLENRFQYLQDTYGKTAKAVDRLMIMKQNTIDLETEIFNLLDFAPQDIPELLEEHSRK